MEFKYDIVYIVGVRAYSEVIFTAFEGKVVTFRSGRFRFSLTGR